MTAGLPDLLGFYVQLLSPGYVSPVADIDNARLGCDYRVRVILGAKSDTTYTSRNTNTIHTTND